MVESAKINEKREKFFKELENDNFENLIGRYKE